MISVIYRPNFHEWGNNGSANNFLCTSLSHILYNVCIYWPCKNLILCVSTNISICLPFISISMKSDIFYTIKAIKKIYISRDGQLVWMAIRCLSKIPLKCVMKITITDVKLKFRHLWPRQLIQLQHKHEVQKHPSHINVFGCARQIFLTCYWFYGVWKWTIYMIYNNMFQCVDGIGKKTLDIINFRLVCVLMFAITDALTVDNFKT